MPQPYRAKHDGYLASYLKTGQAKIIGIGREVKGQKKSGELFPCRLAVSEVKLEDGNRVFTGIIHDLSKQKEAEEQLRIYSEKLAQLVQERTSELTHTVEQLEQQVDENHRVAEALRKSQQEVQEALDKEKQLNELKSRFVSMASHEFRTPLSTIMSSVTLIGRYEDAIYTEKRKKHIDRIKASVRNLTAILNDFLSLGKLEEGRIHNEPQAFRIKDFVEEVAEEMQSVARKGQKIVYLHKIFREEVYLDKKLLKTILQNLLSNAIKYSPEQSHITISTLCDPESCILEVTDEGMGIPEEEQKHLFERFFRAYNATNIQGTGLGLNIVREYVELMNGEITFTSRLNEGTTFRVKIPVSESKIIN